MPVIGYMRVSKADGSQVLDLQRDALLAAGVPERNLYSDTARGELDDRSGLEACLKALREGPGMASGGWSASTAVRWMSLTRCAMTRRSAGVDHHPR
jgi:DNA invertase Pin-like site-specific DNA recombinase